MASKKRTQPTSQGSFRMNFRPTNEMQRGEPPRGTKPTAELTSVQEIFTIMALYLCKKCIFFNTDLKVALYLGALFFISLICDFVTVPKSYMSRSDNIFNQYFVKMAWGWNLLFLVPYLLLTSYVYCCGNKDKIMKFHFPRIVIATGAWFFWTKSFNIIEATFGRCNVKSFYTKESCLKNGFMWNGFDISGHSFILIYGSLVLIEECRSIMNWESIKDFLRNEEHARNTRENQDISNYTNPLRNLSNRDLMIIKESYEKLTPYIRILFIGITLLQLLWDVMLVMTMMYYHIMIEKFVGGSIAILTWFATYRFWYKMSDVPPSLPGEGSFKYIKEKTTPNVFPAARRRTGSVINANRDVPRFMGMPLYGLRNDNSATNITPPSSATTNNMDELINSR